MKLEAASEHEPRREWPVAAGYYTEHSADSLTSCLNALAVRLPINPTEVYHRAEAAVRDAVSSGRGVDGMLSVEELLWTQRLPQFGQRSGIRPYPQRCPIQVNSVAPSTIVDSPSI